MYVPIRGDRISFTLNVYRFSITFNQSYYNLTLNVKEELNEEYRSQIAGFPGGVLTNRELLVISMCF